MFGTKSQLYCSVTLDYSVNKFFVLIFAFCVRSEYDKCGKELKGKEETSDIADTVLEAESMYIIAKKM